MKKYISIMIMALAMISQPASAIEFKSIEGQVISSPVIEKRIAALNAFADLPPLKNNDLKTVNDFVNSFKYKKDSDDHWDTANEFFKNGGGDCEDSAVAKAAYLRETHDVKIAVGRLKDEGLDHAVLIVDDKWAMMSRSNNIYSLKSFGKNFRVFYYVTPEHQIMSDGELK